MRARRLMGRGGSPYARARKAARSTSPSRTTAAASSPRTGPKFSPAVSRPRPWAWERVWGFAFPKRSWKKRTADPSILRAKWAWEPHSTFAFPWSKGTIRQPEREGAIEHESKVQRGDRRRRRDGHHQRESLSGARDRVRDPRVHRTRAGGEAHGEPSGGHRRFRLSDAEDERHPIPHARQAAPAGSQPCAADRARR